MCYDFRKSLVLFNVLKKLIDALYENEESAVTFFRIMTTNIVSLLERTNTNRLSNLFHLVSLSMFDTSRVLTRDSHFIVMSS
jgi:predicted transcriptional regulator